MSPVTVIVYVPDGAANADATRNALQRQVVERGFKVEGAAGTALQAEAARRNGDCEMIACRPEHARDLVNWLLLVPRSRRRRLPPHLLVLPATTGLAALWAATRRHWAPVAGTAAVAAATVAAAVLLPSEDGAGPRPPRAAPSASISAQPTPIQSVPTRSAAPPTGRPGGPVGGTSAPATGTPTPSSATPTSTVTGTPTPSPTQAPSCLIQLDLDVPHLPIELCVIPSSG